MDKLKMQTSNLADENYAKLAELFPNAITETIDENGSVVRAIDPDVLHQEINTHVLSGKEERYQFTWPDKRKSVLLANTPIAAALRPCREESVNFDITENLYIEGDNLDVLKLLRETYLNRVKMIYIDPPYNTGNDFIYEDDFAEDAGEFLIRDSQYDEDGNRMVRNLDSKGRFHTDWLNMMYPRLRIARDLLADDGVIFISIDFKEFDNIKKICTEIFGEANYVGEIVWQTATDNNPSQISMEHEYIIVYAKNMTLQPKWLVQSEKADKINKQFNELKAMYGSDLVHIRSLLKKWISDHEDELKGATHYTYVDDFGVYYPGNSSNTKPGGYTFDIIHPVTGKVCAKPVYGYRWTEKTFWEADKRNDVEWGETESSIPKIKKRIETVTEMLKSYYYEDNRYWTKYINQMFGRRVFENPKSVNLLKYLLKYASSGNSLIVDFFSGSATTAHAVMQLNAEDGGKRKFVMVQLPEVCEENSEAAKAGYKNICEIGKERIRRAGRKIVDESPLDRADLDIGFRVLKLDSSNMKDVYYTPDEYAQMQFSLDGFMDNIKEDRSSEDLLFQVMLDLGIPLSSKIEYDGKIWSVNDGYLIACFGKTDTTLLTEIAKQKPPYAIFRDSSFASDSDMVNFEQVFATHSPTTKRQVL
ncbi:MAG: site-specific DNA-methyltransferase [Oscillospiraceae bacterium]|nr:site-specific DNA-methyltransferase [Oscillospiraceae bacterium]